MDKYIETLKEKRQNALNDIVYQQRRRSETKETDTIFLIIEKIARLKGEVEAYDDAINTYENLKNKGEI